MVVSLSSTRGIRRPSLTTVSSRRKCHSGVDAACALIFSACTKTVSIRDSAVPVPCCSQSSHYIGGMAA